MTFTAVDVGQVAAVGFVTTGLASPVVLRSLRRGRVMDVPSDRSSHLVPTPRGGGLACLTGLVGGVLLAPALGLGPRLLLVTAGSALAALGFADDLRHLGVRLRLGVQLVVAVAASCWAFCVGWPTSPAALVVLVLAAAAAVWIVAYVNAFNFMDGINGLAGAAAAVAGGTFAVIGVDRSEAILAVGGAALLGAALAFLPWNFPRAKFFLGDVGSYLIGGTTSLLIAIGLRAHIPPEALLGPAAVFVADTGWTLLSRMIRGEDWTSAHRTHVYQRLQGLGTTHTRTTLAVTTIMVATSVLGLVSLTPNPWARLLADTMGLLLLVGYLASPASVGRSTGALL